MIRLDQDTAIGRVLPAVRALLGTQTALLLSPVDRGNGLDLERWESDNFANGELLRRTFLRFFQSAPPRYAWYDAVKPEPAQRNRVLEAHDLMGPGELEESAIYHQVLLPLGLHRDRQPRILLCEGPSLLGWFGAFHPEPIEHRQKQLLAQISPAMRERLIIERRLQIAPRTHAALELALDQLGAPAFVLGPKGVILEASQAGRALLAIRKDVRASLRDRVAGRPAALPFHLIPLHERGAADGWLAILPARSPDEQIRASVARAAARWSLTPRQREILEHLLHGHANATISASLGITVRAIELHVTALLDRAGVDSRAALVARVLLAP